MKQLLLCTMVLASLITVLYLVLIPWQLSSPHRSVAHLLLGNGSHACQARHPPRHARRQHSNGRNRTHCCQIRFCPWLQQNNNWPNTREREEGRRSPPLHHDQWLGLLILAYEECVVTNSLWRNLRLSRAWCFIVVVWYPSHVPGDAPDGCRGNKIYDQGTYIFYSHD